MWQDFHCTKTPDTFKSMWSRLFLATKGTTVNIEPLYQQLTDNLFQNMFLHTITYCTTMMLCDTLVGICCGQGEETDCWVQACSKEGEIDDLIDHIFLLPFARQFLEVFMRVGGSGKKSMDQAKGFSVL